MRGRAYRAPMDTVPFGARDVGRDEKRRLVRGLFDAVAGRYDLMNDLMSAGLHRLWKRALVAAAAPRDAARALDLAGGTGDVAFLLRRRFPRAAVTVCDASPAMLESGRARAWDRGQARNPAWAAGDAARLPFPDGAFTLVTCAFGLRNFAELGAALREVRRVLRPGGRFLALEFAPRPDALEGAHARYLARVLPLLGRAVAGREDAYAYLADSIRRFLPAERVLGELREAGLGGARARPRALGVAVQYAARRT